MSESYNLQDLFRKTLIYMPEYHGDALNLNRDKLFFTQAGWVYHFNAIPPSNRDINYWMERTYKELYT